jgi:hypothetical protein
MSFLQPWRVAVLHRFGTDFQKFSISRYIWNKIHDTSEDPVKGLPYAPYLMHIIEQVSGIRFPSDGSNHKLLKISNKLSITAAKELKQAADVARGKGKGASSSRSHRAATSPSAAPSRSTSAEPLSSSSSGKSKKPSKFKFLMNYMFGQCCASAQREHDIQERLYRMEQRAGIVSSPPPPFVPPRDPMQLYDEACAAYADEASSRRRGKSTVPPADEDYIQEDDEDDDDDDGDDGDDGGDEDFDDE